MDDQICFKIVSNPVVEFCSTISDSKTIKYADKATEADIQVEYCDSQLNTVELKDAYTETSEITPANVIIDNGKLLDFLKSIYPIIQTELQKGVTPIFQLQSKRDPLPEFKFFQTVKQFEDSPLNVSCITWLSVSRQNAPVLVVGFNYVHEAWCDHFNSKIILYDPTRITKEYDKFEYKIKKEINVPSCIEVLETKPTDMNYFAGGTFGGELIIYNLQLSTDDEFVEEVALMDSNCGQISGIVWIGSNKVEDKILTAHRFGRVILWRHSETSNVLDKTYLIQSGNEPEIITCIAGLNSNHFLVGSLDGHTKQYSLSQEKKRSTESNEIEAIGLNFSSHQFAVNVIQKIESANEAIVIIGDLSGEFQVITVKNDSPNVASTFFTNIGVNGKIFPIQHCQYVLCGCNEGTLSIIRLADMKTIKFSEPIFASNHGSFNVAVNRAENWVAIASSDKGYCHIYHLQ